MKGDFSRWPDYEAGTRPDNLTGVLHQQGRGLLDQDWNAAQQILSRLRRLQARDGIGAHVAAVPAELRDSFRVTEAATDGTAVNVTVHPGRIWAGGHVLEVAGDAPYTVQAGYLGPAFRDPPGGPDSIAAGVRDAVVLEVWEEALNGFQLPRALIEPALGGVDTTERVQLYHRLSLLRLEEGDECGNLAGVLDDDFAGKGRLSVTPAPEVTIEGDCPLEAGGGYTGFEHYLYRIEIADPDAGGRARFKWSRFGGGLVGRGIFDALENEIEVTDNDQMINHCGLDEFYGEVLAPGPDGGRWRVAMTGTVTLSADGILAFTDGPHGTWPGAADEEAFIRLWDGIAPISDYPDSGDPRVLPADNGIRLAFEAPAADNRNYIPGDYWTFPVRAAGVESDPSLWPDNAPPHGVHYQRVPLGIIRWDAAPETSASAPADIHDCRHVFQPLAQLDSCCVYTVGDGMRSYGDFDSIQAAIEHLPPAGGRICVLAGDYPENLVIDRDNIHIQGCGADSRLAAESDDPVVLIRGARDVSLRGLSVQAHESDAGILVEQSDTIPENVRLRELALSAAGRSAIEVRACRDLEIRDNKVTMQDTGGDWHGIFVIADDVLIEHNLIQVPPGVDDAGNVAVRAGRGGLHLGGTCERVRVVDNRIEGGIGNGITLGSLVLIDPQGAPVQTVVGWVAGNDAECEGCADGSTYWRPPETADEGDYQSAGALYDIRIERNRISDMGLNGIGVVAFFNLEAADEFISVFGLDIIDNTIRDCLWRQLEEIPDEMQEAMGYGGIALADVDNLVVENNTIENNGPDHLQPVCGIFVLHAEGIHLARNRVLNNGMQNTQTVDGARRGARGGVFVVFATAPKRAVVINESRYPRQNGVPALSMHDNIVRQPLGRSLSITALGPVSVHGNQLTSQSFVGAGSPSFMGATVMIFNLGVSNELYLQQIMFSGQTLDDVAFTGYAQTDEEFINVPQAGLDTQRPFGYLGNGNVLFNDNQVMLDLTDYSGFTYSIASVAIASLDDVAIEDNQFDAAFALDFDDILLTQAITLGWTVRMTGNRFKEAMFGSLLSAVSLSLIANITAHNEATHCIWTYNILSLLGMSGYQVSKPNVIAFDVFGLCSGDEFGFGGTTFG